MICKNCGHKNKSKSVFCENCGARAYLEVISTASPKKPNTVPKNPNVAPSTPTAAPSKPIAAPSMPPVAQSAPTAAPSKPPVTQSTPTAPPSKPVAPSKPIAAPSIATSKPVVAPSTPAQQVAPKRKKGKLALVLTSIVLCAAIILGSVLILPNLKQEKSTDDNKEPDNKKPSDAVTTIDLSAQSSGSYAFLEEGFTDVKIVDETSAIEAVASVADVLSITNAKEELSVCDVNKIGNETFYRLEQNYNGVPVYGRTVSLACYADGSSAALTSNYLSIPSAFNTTPTISLEDAQNAVKTYLEADDLVLETDDCKLIIFETESSDIILAYHITTGFSQIIVDANTSEILIYSSTVNPQNVEIQSITNPNEKTIGTQNTDGTYALHNSEYNISIFDIIGCRLLPEEFDGKNFNAVYFNVKKDFGKDIISSTKNQFEHYQVVLLNDFIGISDFYKNLGFDGFDQLQIAINDGSDSGENAYGGSQLIDGRSCASIYLGYGFDYNDKATLCHEYTHGVFREFVTDNTLWNEDVDIGAINEGYADIFGVLISAKLNDTPDTTPDWRIGVANRNIEDPSAIGYPETLQDVLHAPNYEGTYLGMPMTYYYIDTKDNATNYSHFASTLISHSAYLMWNGIDGVSIDSDTLAQLWYKSLMLLQSTSDFSQCRNAVELTAKIMQKNGELTEEQCATVSNAFEQVGIDNAVINYKYTVKNNFDLSVLVSDKDITTDENSYLQSNFNLEVVKLYTDGNSEQILFEENISDQYSLELEDGYYGLIIRDAKSDDSTPINIWIKVDNENAAATDEIILHTDFTATKVVKPTEITQEEAREIACGYWNIRNDDNYSVVFDGTVQGADDNEYYRFNLKAKIDDGDGEYHWSTWDTIYINTTTGECILDPTNPSYKPDDEPSSPPQSEGALTQSELLGEWKMTLSIDSYCNNMLKSDEIDSYDIMAVELFRECFEDGELTATVVFKDDGTFDMIADEEFQEVVGEYVEKNSDYELDGEFLYFEVEEGEDYGFSCYFNYEYNGTTLVLGKTKDNDSHPYTGATFTKTK